jgi:putative hydrolase of the HAD superfamily
MRETAGIFDGDDTLWETQPFYERAMARFASLVSATLHIQSDGIRDLLLKVDSSNVPAYGFGPLRFRLSMDMLYETLCQQTGQNPGDEILREIDRIANGVITLEPKIMPGAKQVVEELSGSCALFLYTIGDCEQQRQKLRYVELDGYFTALYATELKTDHELSRIVQEQGLLPAVSWVVGNSAKSDINPALQLGFRCIWLQSASWTYDDEELKPGWYSRFHLLRKFLASFCALIRYSADSGDVNRSFRRSE